MPFATVYTATHTFLSQLIIRESVCLESHDSDRDATLKSVSYKFSLNYRHVLIRRKRRVELNCREPN